MKMRPGIAGIALVVLAVSSVGCVPPPGAPPTGAGSCVFSVADQPASVAFCETFDAPAGNPATRSGDLNPVLWGVSRLGESNPGQGLLNTIYPATMTACGSSTSVLPPQNVKVCGGRLYEAIYDHGSETTQAIYPKQPFDIAGRTGTIVFDVGADSQGPHAAWPELWWTDQPVPAPGSSASLPLRTLHARNSFGLVISHKCGQPNQIGIEEMDVTRNYAFAQVPFAQLGCVNEGSAGGPLNHFEVRINQNHVEVWGSDAGSLSVRRLARADNVNLTMTRGVIWLEDLHYNANKFGNQGDHVFAWDNVGFDGPRPYRDLTFDTLETPIAQNGGINQGFVVSPGGATVLFPGVTWTQTPTTVLVMFTFMHLDPIVPTVSVNGNPPHSTPWPFDPAGYTYRTIAVPVPFSEIHPGTNTVTFSGPQPAVVANVDLALIAASPVP